MIKRYALALAATLLLSTGAAGIAHAADANTGDTVRYTFYTNSGHLDIGLTTGDGGTYSRTNRYFIKRKRNGVHYGKYAYTATTDYMFPSSRLSTDEPENESWVECFIQVNGTVVAHQYSSGPYASVYCS